jgi:signal transduction histidine kinase
MQRLMRFLKILVALWLAPKALQCIGLLIVLLAGFELPITIQPEWWIIGVGSLISGVVLALLVFTPWPARRLGRAFIPVVLGLVILEQSLSSSLRPDWRPTEPFFFLLIPTILAAAIYGRKGALLSSTLALALTTAFRTLLHTIAAEFAGPLAVAGNLARIATLYLVPYLVAILAEAQNEQHARHAAAIEQLATSRERNRLARELHDTLAHSLSALVVQLGAVRTLLRSGETVQAEEELARAHEVAREGLDGARRAIMDLRAAPLETLGVSGALHQAASDFEERSGVPTTLAVEGQEAALRRDEEQALYRIAEEALENAARHASATRVEIRLAFAPGSVTLTVEDDGVGLGNSDRKEGLGMLGMMERAELVGGQCTVERADKQGTRVLVTLPRQEV